jgi:truncated hemoglobin YjbI
MKRLLTVAMVVAALMFGSMNVLTQGALANNDDKKKMDKDASKKADKDAAKAEKEASKKADKDAAKAEDDESKKMAKDDDKKGKKADKKKSLYVRLGGKKAITAVVDEFVTNVAGDTRINKFFEKTVADPKRAQALKDNLVNQICEASGGPCKYKGLDMVTAHKGMNISDADFGALVEDLVKALDKFNVGETEKNELLGALGGMKGDIVGK